MFVVDTVQNRSRDIVRAGRMSQLIAAYNLTRPPKPLTAGQITQKSPPSLRIGHSLRQTKWRQHLRAGKPVVTGKGYPGGGRVFWQPVRAPIN